MTTSTLPVRAAIMSGDTPELVTTRFGLAIAAKSLPTIAVFPFRQASESGVTPRSVVALTLAPARINASTVSKAFQ